MRVTDYRKIKHILDARIRFEEMTGENISKVKQLVLAALTFTKAKMEARKTN